MKDKAKHKYKIKFVCIEFSESLKFLIRFNQLLGLNADLYV